jgi:hypothetical protein
VLRIRKVTALSPAVTAAPVSASRAGPASFPRPPISATATAATAAPPNANQTKPSGVDIPNSVIAASTATEAPRSDRAVRDRRRVAREALHDRSRQGERGARADADDGAGTRCVTTTM